MTPFIPYILSLNASFPRSTILFHFGIIFFFLFFALSLFKWNGMEETVKRKCHQIKNYIKMYSGCFSRYFSHRHAKCTCSNTQFHIHSGETCCGFYHENSYFIWPHTIYTFSKHSIVFCNLKIILDFLSICISFVCLAFRRNEQMKKKFKWKSWDFSLAK